MTMLIAPLADSSLLFAMEENSIFMVERGWIIDSALYFGEVSNIGTGYITDFFLALLTTFW